MLVLTPLDIIPILFCLAGLIVPQVYSNTKYKAIAVIACMFILSFAGAWIMHALSPAQEFGMMFSRLFSLIGISHITFISVQSSMYWRLMMKRVGLYKTEEEQTE